MSAETSNPCRWVPDAYDGEPWETDCGASWVFNDGGPLENLVRFCPNCGKPVEVVAPNVPDEDEGE